MNDIYAILTIEIFLKIRIRKGRIMPKTKKTNSELIIDILRSGQTLKLSEITAMIYEISGKNVKMTDISSQLSRLSDENKKEIGFLIKRQKTEEGNYAYTLVKEALDMIPEEMYDLTRKTGKGRFTLADAIHKYPKIKKHVGESPVKAPRQAKKREEQPAAEANADRQMQYDDVDFKDMFKKLIEAGIKVDVNITVRFS